MKYSEYIHDFLDGTLDINGEEELFQALAVQAELRLELKDMLLLKMVSQKIRRSLMVPDSYTQEVFSLLGFSADKSIIAGNVKHIEQTSKSFFSQYRQTLITAPITAIITALLLWWQISPFVLSTVTPFSTQHLSYYNNRLPQDIVKNTIGRDGNVIASIDTIQKQTIIREVFRDVVRYVTSPTMIIPTDSEKSEQNVEPDDQESITPTMIMAALDNPIAPIASQSIAELSPIKQTSGNTEELEPFSRRIRVEARGLAVQSIPKAMMSSGVTPFLGNTALNAMYIFSPHHAIGVEAGQEAFFQQYIHETYEGVFLVSQNPTLFWTGLAYRYTVLPDNAISPIIHGVLGGTKNGPIGRIMVGLTYSPDTRTQFLLGAEGSMMLYNEQRAWFTARNVGITYGVSVKF